jgi:hypothetical protein
MRKFLAIVEMTDWNDFESRCSDCAFGPSDYPLCPKDSEGKNLCGDDNTFIISRVDCIEEVKE